MAISITTSLDSNVAAFAPVILAGTTTRNPFTSGVRQSATLTAMANSSSYLKITTSDNFTGWILSDTIMIEGATGDFAQFNGQHKIKSILSSTEVTVWTLFGTATTGTYGTAYRMNVNLYIKADIYNDSSEVIATLYNFVNTEDGSFSFDISRPLQYELGNNFTFDETQPSTENSVHEYTVKLYETFQSSDYGITEIYSASDPTTIAHRCTDLSTDFTGGSKLLTGDFYYSDKILIHFLVNMGGGDVELRFTPDTGSATNTGALTGNNWHYAYVYEPPTDAKVVRVASYSVPEGAKLSDFIYIRKIGCASTILYFCNRNGGYEGYEFHDYDDDQKTTKVDKFTGKAWQQRTLFGKDYARATNQNVRDLITSPEVYDEDLVTVQVTTDSLNYRAQEVNPKVTVKYDEDFISDTGNEYVTKAP